MVDIRRERQLIQRNQTELQRDIGQTVLWACYDPGASEVDETYNTPGGHYGRVYFRPFDLSVMWINPVEANVNYSADRTDTRKAVTLAISMNMANESGMVNPDDAATRIYDIFQYRNSWYDVRTWEILGRNGSDDYIIGASAVQIWPSESFVFEPDFPGS